MAASTLSTGSVADSPPANRPQDELRKSRMRQSRILGILFLSGFVVYGGGLSLATTLVAGPDFLGALAPLRTLLVLGAFLMLLNTAVDIAKAVLFYPILERHSQRAALTYFAAIIVQVVFLSIGALAILMLVPLSRIAADAGATTLGTILVELNGTAYQVGQMTLGVGATVLCVILFRTRLIPRWIAVAGLIGYPSHVVGTIAELFGVEIGLYLTMPGFLFELALPLYLLIKGFRPDAYAGPAAARLATV
jgi:hypothetical protein